MNYIRHLTSFFDRAAKDYRLNPTHISLYMSIFQLWNVNRFKNPISLSRSEVMELSKVCSKTTYHKCMKELQQLGYLRYDPSYHPLRGSWVHLFDFNAVGQSSQSKNCPGTGLVLDRQWTGTGQAVYKSASESKDSRGFEKPLNISKHIKHNKLSFQTPTEIIEERKKEKYETSNEKDNSEPANSASSSTDEQISREPAENSSGKIPDTLEQVTQFFIATGYEESDGVKFFHYYSATGWKVGGKSPIQNWQAAAHSWILNSHNTGKNGKSTKPETGPGRLHTITDKNYSEPL